MATNAFQAWTIQPSPPLNGSKAQGSVAEEGKGVGKQSCSCEMILFEMFRRSLFCSGGLSGMRSSVEGLVRGTSLVDDGAAPCFFLLGILSPRSSS